MNKFIRISIKVVAIYLLIGICMYLIALKNNVGDSFLNTLLLWPMRLLDDLKDLINLILLSTSFSNLN